MNTRILFLTLVLLNLAFADQQYEGSSIPCYDEKGKAQKCIPQFENAAFGLEAEATNTCGQKRPIQYCVLSNTQGIEQGCNWCNSSRQHSTAYMTDASSSDTWWQSETMYEDIQYPNYVNITLYFGKTFDITHITLTFKSPRPHSFAIYKKTTDNDPWIPYQYYSADCKGVYNKEANSYIVDGMNDSEALCTAEYSDIAPTSDVTVPFATLEGRRSAHEFSRSAHLWEWVTASAVRITLNRLNTYGDEIWNVDRGLKSYFYAISDFNIGARCKCNGHAADCIKSYTRDGVLKRICRCEHNTAGPDCNDCLPFYNDVPWQRASEEQPFECKECNCNGFSNRCYFDKELYQLTGHGGHCLECSSNRDGPNCEKCRINYYQPKGETACYPCYCNETGSRTLQCNSEGKCFCKPGVTGDKCDRCDNNFYNFDMTGCKECGCNVAGSLQNQASCDSVTGICQCKDNVEGKQCSGCKPGFFNLDEENEFGCTPCFCYGHSGNCQSATGYYKVTLESGFIRSSEKWKGETIDGRHVSLAYNSFSTALELTSTSADPLYFVASERYLGDQRASYNHDLFFKLRINDHAPKSSYTDIVIEGAGKSISQAIFGQGNPMPSTSFQMYKFRLHEHPNYGWTPRLSNKQFISILSNVTALKIRGTYTIQGVGYLDEVRLETGRRDAAGIPATWIEMCSCPDGYVGQFCESCAPGYRHDPNIGGPHAPCIPCDCNSHAKICDADTGRCICEHNTAGENCERCARGYYGNALRGTAYDCNPCPCPNHGACMLVGDDDMIVCLECPPGYTGPLCEVCSDGYFGDLKDTNGQTRICQLCDCNLNVDPNAIGNCNRTTGECLKCIYNTGGTHCDQCLPGYYGDALAPKKGDCKPCSCHPLGTQETETGERSCDQFSGQCKCKAHVIGTNCDQCEPGFYDLDSSQGCQTCACDPVGSLNNTCDVQSGQCHCRPGVTGQRCDKCLSYHFGFSIDGCKTCDCDNIGSTSLQCDDKGQCPCLENIEGRRCDRCKENKYDRQRGCINCPVCYNLVQDAVNTHRQKLQVLSLSIANISNSDSISLDADFEEKLKTVRSKVSKLDEDVRAATSQEGQLTSSKLNDFYTKLGDIKNVSKEIFNLTHVARGVLEEAKLNITEVEQRIELARKTLNGAEEYLFSEGMSALEKAIKKSAEVGEQNAQMSQIARDARAAAQKLEDQAAKIKAVADEALNISNEAHDKAVETINQQKNVTDALKSLNSTLIFTGERLNSTVDAVENLRGEVDSAYQESVDILRDIRTISVPIVDVTSFKDRSLELTKTANENQQKAEKLLSENRNLMLELNNELRSAEMLLSQGNIQQQTADELLAEVDRAFYLAEDAVRLGNKTLQEAQKTFTTLQGFNDLVQESKDKAKDARQKIPEIEKLIMEAERKTQEVNKTLSGAKKNADLAKETAEAAEKKFAEVASKEAYDIRKRAEATQAEQSLFVTQVYEVKNQVIETSDQIKDLKNKAEGDHRTISEAKEKVGQAKANAAEVTKLVEKATADIDTLIKELNNLPEIDEMGLMKLTEKLNEAEKQFQQSKVDEELVKFKSSKMDQADRIRKYQNELELVQKDIADLEKINNTLPKGCFKRGNIET